ncbi:MAG: hypothetical protein QW291_01860 [Thermofilaceae archaeon]
MSTTARNTVVAYLLIAIMALVFPTILLSPQPDSFTVYVNLYTTVTALIAVLHCFRILETLHQSSSSLIRPWIFITAGLALWTSAELTFSTHLVLLGEAPLLSLADFLWLIGYPFLFHGISGIASPISRLLRQAGLKNGKRVKLFVHILVIAFIFMILAVRSPIILEKGVLEIIMTLYVVLDLALLTLALSTVTVFYPGYYAFPLTLICASFAMFAVSDFLYMMAGAYESTLADLIYAFTYVTLNIGLYLYWKKGFYP